MRRQVKPFVTEYRGNARRNKDLHTSAEQQHESQAPRSRSYAEAEKLFQSETSDDSYEAALRAADALFDTSSRKPEPTRGKALPSTLEPNKAPPASMHFSKPPSEMPTETLFEDDGSRGGDLSESDAVSSPRRILQAIEPPAEDRFAALEAERAPKRRGRKPGSKNKPKSIVGDDWGAVPSASLPLPAELVVVQMARAPVREPAPSLAMPELDVIVDLGDAGDDQALPQPRNRNDKFGWKRAGLRPGERWKRRLPKAAW